MRCRYCNKDIVTDGSYHYTSNMPHPAVRAYWQDEDALYYCLDPKGEYIRPHRPFMSDVEISVDEILEETDE